MEEIKKQAREMFDERFKELNGETEIWKGNKPPNHTDIKSFIDQIINLAVSKERESIVELLEKTKLPVNSVSKDGFTTLMYIPDEGFNRHINNRIEWVINLINTK